MAEFVLENNYFQFFGNVKQQISVTVTGTKFAPIFTYVFMGQVEDGFLRAQGNVPLVWLHYIENVFFFICTHGENELKSFMEKVNQFYPSLSFRYEPNKKEIAFLDFKLNLFQNNFTTDLHVKSTDKHQY